MEKRILLVDDEKDILEFLSYNLEKEGYHVTTARSGNDAIEKAKESNPHIIVLDVMMPKMDGLETCVKLRESSQLKETLIVFLTARSDEDTEIEGFISGADDYITKPIKPKAFVSRINALMRRVNLKKKKNIVKVGNLTINRNKYNIEINGKEMDLPRKEFEILMLLASSPEQVFTREDIFKNVWDENIIVGDRTIDVHIRKLREKIGEHYIKTVKGVGYKFQE